MKCCSMKLAARTEERQPLFPKSGPRCHPALLENDDNDHDDDDDDDDDSSRFPSSGRKSEQPSEFDQPYLSVLNLIPPNDIKAFNTGSSFKRWANKRPRLKSAKLSNPKGTSSMDTDSDSMDVSSLIKELQGECDFFEETESDVLNNNECEEVDPDIQRLLEETHVEEKSENGEEAVVAKRISFDMDQKTVAEDGSSKRKSKRRRKKKSKEKNKDKEKSEKSKKKLTKTVSFSLSKPPTPQTEQIIRVDVISNYSVEFDAAESSRTDAMMSECNKFTPERVIVEKEDEKFSLRIFCPPHTEEAKDFVVASKKAVLFPRYKDK